jgi:integrase
MKNSTRNAKGATVNREMAYLRCMLNFAIERKYVSENPASRVKPFDQRRERPAKRMLSLEDEQGILDDAPPYFRVAIVLSARTGGRIYTETFSLRWDQIDLDHKVFFPGGKPRQNAHLSPYPDRTCPRCSSQLEKETGQQKPISFSESGQTRPADHHA